MVKPATKREVVNYLVSEYAINIRQACKSLNLERSSYYYQPKKKDDSELIDCLNTLFEKHPSYGFKKMFHSLRNQGFLWNHKKVYSVYKKLGLNILRKRRRRLASRERQNLEIPSNYNEVCSMDFMSDSLFNSRRFRTFNIIDDYKWEAIWIETGLSIGAMHMTDLLEWIVKGGNQEPSEQIMVLNLQVLYLPIGVTNTELKFDISNLENQHKMLLLRDSIVAIVPKF